MLLLVKDTKFESKSQHLPAVLDNNCNCFYWSKIQNLKANHNIRFISFPKCFIAFTGQRYKIWKQITTLLGVYAANKVLLLLVKDTKFESKSQPDSAVNGYYRDCFYWSKIQNLKANHNSSSFALEIAIIAFTGQRYKIWKQITTCRGLWADVWRLLLLVKDTKFESKSQQGTKGSQGSIDCFYWSKIQNLKANHNSICPFFSVK